MGYISDLFANLLGNKTKSETSADELDSHFLHSQFPDKRGRASSSRAKQQRSGTSRNSASPSDDGVMSNPMHPLNPLSSQLYNTQSSRGSDRDARSYENEVPSRDRENGLHSGIESSYSPSSYSPSGGCAPSAGSDSSSSSGGDSGGSGSCE